MFTANFSIFPAAALCRRIARMSMKPVICVSVATLLLALAGCGGSLPEIAAQQMDHDAKANGSPFRAKIRKIPGGGALITMVMIDLPRGDTKADGVLKRDILSQIKKAELSRHRGAPEVEEVRLLSDGREVWVLKNQSQGVAYVVTLSRARQGGTYFSISGPHTFQRG